MVAQNVEYPKKLKSATLTVDMIASGVLGLTMAASFLVPLLQELRDKTDKDKLAKSNISRSMVERYALEIHPNTMAFVLISQIFLLAAPAVPKSLGVIGLRALLPAAMVAHDDELAM